MAKKNITDHRKTIKVPRKRKGYIDHHVSVRQVPSSAGLTGMPPSKVSAPALEQVDFARLVKGRYEPSNSSLAKSVGGPIWHEGFYINLHSGKAGSWASFREHGGTSADVRLGRAVNFQHPEPISAEAKRALFAESKADLGILVAAYNDDRNAGLAEAAAAARDRIEQRLAVTADASDEYLSGDRTIEARLAETYRLDTMLKNADKLDQAAAKSAAEAGIVRELQSAGLGGSAYQYTEVGIVRQHAVDVAANAVQMRMSAWAGRERLGWTDPQTASKDRDVRLGLIRSGTTTATLEALTRDPDPEVRDEAGRYWRSRAGQRGQLLPQPSK